MFAAVRVPASKTSTAYVCFACRSQRVANPQQWRPLSTETHTTSAAQDLSPLPPPPKPTFPSSDPPASAEVSEKPKKARAKKAKKAQQSSSTEVDVAVSNNAAPTENVAESMEGPGVFEAKPESPKISKTIEEKRAQRSIQKMTRALKSKNVPLPTYKTINEAGVIRCWQAEIAFAGQKFEVEAPNKKAVAVKIKEKVMEYIQTMPQPDASGTEVSDPKEPRARPIRTKNLLKRRAIRKIPSLSVRKLTSDSRKIGRLDPPVGSLDNLSLREALTGIRARTQAQERTTTNEHSGPVKRERLPRTKGGLPHNVAGYFNATEKVETLDVSSLEVVPLHVPQPPVPPLSYGLDRVLFNPGVYRLRDPRSRVYNFDPYLEKVVPADEFDFAALKGYKVASTDPTLSNIATENGLKYFTSTSSLTSVLMTFHFLISQWRPIDISILSKKFEGPDKTNFTSFTKAPTSIILKPAKNGGYAIDKDEDTFGNTVLSLVGRSLEKLLTVPKKEFEKYRKSIVTGKSSVESQDTDDAYHYTGIGNLLVRSQLDGHDPRLPGSGIFDIKTRAVLPIRMDGKGKLDVASSYELRNDHGQFESFEREYHDMLRAPMLKYSMQARLGRMDGIFVAYHNISRLFGFQYVSLEEIDRALHGSADSFRGDQELRASINILQDVLDRASEKFPDQPLRMMFETRPGDVPFMNIFVEPVTTEYLQERVEEKQRQIDALEHAAMFPDAVANAAVPEKASNQSWEEINKQVQEEIQNDDAASVSSSDNLRQLFGVLEKRQEAQVDSKGMVQRFKELFLGQVKEQDKAVDAKDRLAQAQSAAIDIIRETSQFKEADIIDSKRPERREELNNIIAAIKELDKTINTLSDEVFRINDTEINDQLDRLLEVTRQQLKEGNRLRVLQSFQPKILAMALTVRNKINGSYVEGPPEVNREDQWDIEYSVQEMKDDAKAWERYDRCKARKDNASSFSKDDASDDRWYGGRFMTELAEWSRKGAAWRARQDEIDAGIARPTVFEPIDTSPVFETAGSDEVVVKDVDDYLGWLYEGKGGDGKKEV